MNKTEEQLIIESAKHDAEAFGKLYDQYYSCIYGYLLKRVADVELAADLSSETWIKALNNINKFKFNGAPFSCWLYRIAGNCIIDYYRKNKRLILDLEEIAELKSDQDLQAEIIQAEDQLKKYLDFLEVQKILAKLDQKYQEVITLRFFEDKRIDEICEILEKKEGTVKSLLHRGIILLRGAMQLNQ